MNPIIASVAVCAVLGVTAAKPASDFYATRYDHIDVDTILNNRRMVNYYAACLLNRGPCPPQGVEFKRILPEALVTNCEKCTEKQKAIALRTIRRIQKEYPKVWDQLKEVWDPDDIYVKKFEATFGKKSTAPKPQIFNRFGEDDETTISSNEIPSSNPLAASGNVPTDVNLVTSVVYRPTTFSTIPSTTTTTTTTTTSTTTPRRPSTNINTIPTRRPVERPLLVPSDANLDATVSLGGKFKLYRMETPYKANLNAGREGFGGKVVRNLVMGFENVTKQVARVGANVAGALITSIQQVARPLAVI